MDSKDRYLREQGLTFNGKITASLSHELNNAVAIINEYNGLLTDMVEASKSDIPIDDKKLERATKKIAIQIERSQELVKRLNRFAHSSDSFNSSINIIELAELIISLSQRLLGLKGMDIEFSDHPDTIIFRTNPFYVQLAVFTCFEIFMNDPDINRHLQLKISKSENQLRIDINGVSLKKDEDVSQKQDLLYFLLEQINGTLEVEENNGASCMITFLFEELKPTI